MRLSSPAALMGRSVLPAILAIVILTSLAHAQSGERSTKRKALKPIPGLSLSPGIQKNSAPPATTDTWTGSGGTSSWSNNSNWNNGAPSGQNVVINLTTAATVEDDNASIVALTLSNSGDSVTVANNTVLTLGGDVSNAGTITLAGTNAFTFVQIGASNVTLSGSGTVVLSSSSPDNVIQATTSGNMLTNQSSIVGEGQIGNASGLVINNSGTINANVSGATLTLNQSAASTNKDILEASGGGQLQLYGSSWTNTGGTITAATGSDVVLDAGVTVTGGTLSTSGTGVVYGDGATLVGLTNTGQFQVQNGYVTDISGTINNTGTITLNGTNAYTFLQLNGNATLTGSGTVVLGSASPYNTIEAAASGDILTNQSTIVGEGQIGNASGLVVNNSGTINANVSGATLILNQAAASTNTGTMEATGGGTLQLYGSSWTNTGGNITAATGSAVVLDAGVTVTGGTLTGSGTGVVYGDGATLVGLTTAGNFQVQNSYVTNLQGTINNTGTITVAASNADTFLNVTSAGATLSGGGTIVMGAGGQYSFIDGPSGASFTNSNNTIEGTGMIGNADLTLVNNGTINANASPTVLNAPLELYSGSGGITNTGTLEATNGGDLYIYGSAVTNSGSGAVIKAVGADSSGNASYVLLNAATINGGTLTTSGAGVIYGEGGTTLVGLTNAGSFQVLNNAVAYLSGTITNTGTMTVSASNAYTYLDLAANTTLTGGGTVVMGAGGPYSIIGGPSNFTLTNSNNTIEGDGNIGNGAISFVNNGTVNANTSGQTLTLQPVAGTNTGTLEATNGAQLELYQSNWTNTGGTITAATGSDVLLYGTTVTGGTLTTSGTGVIYGENNATLVGLTNAGSFEVPNNAVAYLSGTINNTGTMTLGASNAYTFLDLAANTTLAGGGTVVMGAGGPYSILGGASGTTLTNSNNTIEGDGNIGNGAISFVNNGTVNANTSGQTLTLQPIAGTNTKTMEATNGAQLELYQSSWTNTGGTITAATGSDVLLYGTTVTGGTLATSGTGVIYAENSAILANLTNAGSFEVPNNFVAYLSGTINNTGTMTLGASNADTFLDLAANTTLTGSGKVIMGAGGPYSFIDGASGLTLTNSGNTIEGDGNIGNGHLVVTNQSGSIIANVNGQSLTINSSGAGFTNNATVEGTNGGTLAVLGTLTNYSSSTDTLTGGTYIANGGNVTFAAGNSTGITTLSANVTEEAGGQIVNTTNSGNALANLTSITSKGSLTIGGPTFIDAGAFSNAGSLTILSGESFTVGSLTQISGGSLTAGTYVLDANLNLSGATQNITTNAANLTLAGGTIENANSTNALGALATSTGKLTFANNANFTTAGNFSNTGTLTVNSGSSFSVAGTLAQISGSTLSGGTFLLGGNLNVGSGISITTNSSTLTLEGGTIMSGAANALAGLSKNTKSLTLANGASFTTGGSFTNSGTLTVNSGSTFAVNPSGSLTNYNSTSKTLTGGTYSVAGTLSAANLNIVTDAANITLNGTGQFVNSTNSSNALAGLTTIASTGSFTLASNAKFTTAGNFTNSGKLTVNSGSTFSVAGTLSNLSSGTLSGGTYTIGGMLQLTSANGGIITNSATLTLTGPSAKILDGTNNALSTFNNNTGTFTLSGNAALTTASSNFSNTGTVVVSKGSTLTVGGTTNSYNQTAGTTTVDGTLAGNGTAGISLTGGKLQGAGTLKGNVSSNAAINVGDAGKAGLLAITGTYSQLSSGTLNVSIGGTTVGTQYSQLKVTGTASLGGTLTAGMVNAFTPSVGQTFTILTASSISGAFTNTTIAINTTEHFVISYTSTGVVLTVVAGPATKGSSSQPTALVAVASRKRALRAKPVAVRTSLHHRFRSDVRKPLLVASLKSGGSEKSKNSPIWARMPLTRSWDHVRSLSVTRIPQAVNLSAPRSGATPSNHMAGAASPVRVQGTGWAGVSKNHRLPVRMPMPALPRVR